VLDVLIGQQLSAVTFVQDYVQLDFDGKRLTANVWPIVRIDEGARSVNDVGYRDQLCSFIMQKVIAVFESDAAISIEFGRGQISIDLTDHLTIEHLILEDTATNAWSWW
jgi:hypothetical protein